MENNTKTQSYYYPQINTNKSKYRSDVQNFLINSQKLSLRSLKISLIQLTFLHLTNREIFGIKNMFLKLLALWIRGFI